MSQAETIMLDSTPERRIAEIIFRGGEWKHATEIRSAIKAAADEHELDAILLNLSDFRYHGGDYVSGFLMAFFDDDKRAKRPACFLAAAPGVRALFNTLDPTGVFNIRYFDDHGEAVRYLQSRLKPIAS